MIMLLGIIGTGSALYAADIGSRIGSFQLPDALGEMRTLRSFSGKAVAIVFWSYKCPVALAYIQRVEELRKKYEGKGVSVFTIAAGANETPAEIRANITNLKISVPVLLDSEGNVAERLGATHSPSVFIVDGEGVLRYKGALDNNKRPGESGRISYAEDALDSILSGREIRVADTRPFGCGLKLAKAVP
jgi:peroxiredoxin